MSKNINKKDYQFKAEMIYDQDDFLGAYKVTHYNQKYGKKNFYKSGDLIYKIIYWVVGSLLIILGTYSLMYNFIFSTDYLLSTSFYYTILSIFVGIFVLLLNTNFFGKLSWRYYKGKGKKITYKFYNDYFMLEEDESYFDYSSIKALYEDNKRYYLYINNKVMHIIRKVDLSNEDINEFTLFIKKQTNREIITI